LDTHNARRYWDNHVAPSNLPEGTPLTVESWREEIDFYLTPEQQFAHAALGAIEGLRVLEIGSGVGVHAVWLAQQRARVLALDTSLARLSVLRDVAAQVGTGDRVFPVCARAEQLPFRSDRIDALYTKATLIHTELDRAMAEGRRVLAPSGVGVFCEPTTSNPFAWLYRRLLGPAEWRTITRYFSRQEEQLVAETFGRVEQQSFYFLAFGAFYWQFGRRRLRRFQRWLRVLHAVDRLLFAVCPPLRRLAWFRVYVVRR
jgi:ubiquinone/menaquinone biosynthesis C-methylase UbiE